MGSCVDPVPNWLFSRSGVEQNFGIIGLLYVCDAVYPAPKWVAVCTRSITIIGCGPDFFLSKNKVVLQVQ